MLRPIVDIRIKIAANIVLYFDFCHEVEVESSWKDLTNKATIVLPRKIKTLTNGPLNELVKEGDQLKIRAGYDTELVDEFVGYVSSVSGKAPFKIECEDLMWKLKQTDISITIRETTLSDLLQKILPPGIEFQASNQIIGKVRYSKVSVTKILEDLKQKQGVVSYARNGKLYVGEAYPVSWRGDANREASFAFKHDIITDNLSFKSKKEVKVKIKVISRQANGKDVTLTYPNDDKNRELHTYHAHNGLSKKELKVIAERNYDKFLYDGFRGEFETFGLPYVDHGYVTEIIDPEHPEKNGRYLTDKTTMTIGVGGYRRTIKLGPRS